MYSEKLESIPKTKSQGLRTYLSRASASDSGHITRRQIAKEAGLDEATVQTILSELTSSGVLKAKLEIRCPYCNTQHGRFARKSEVPEVEERCFNCGNDFQKDNSQNWEVIYEVSDSPDDFFRGERLHISYYVEEKRDLPASFFESELERLEGMENPQKRGREFDKFVGLLFQQLPGVEVRLKQSGDAGEIDIYMHCLDSPQWLHRLVGSQTIIENKWEQNSTETSEISKFREKSTELTSCYCTYFISMNGFSRGQKKQLGALAQLRSYRNPRMKDLWKEDVKKMVQDGTPRDVLRDEAL